MNKCFACGKRLGKNPPIADTRDGQRVYVGSECFKYIKLGGDNGYQPPLGGPRLWTFPDNLNQKELNEVRKLISKN